MAAVEDLGGGDLGRSAWHTRGLRSLPVALADLYRDRHDAVKSILSNRVAVCYISAWSTAVSLAVFLAAMHWTPGDLLGLFAAAKTPAAHVVQTEEAKGTTPSIVPMPAIKPDTKHAKPQIAVAPARPAFRLPAAR